MAMKVTAELMSGEVIALDVPSEMKTKELKEELEAQGTCWDQQAKLFPEVSLKRWYSCPVCSGMFQASCRTIVGHEETGGNSSHTVWPCYDAQAFNPFEDEVARLFSTASIIVGGEQLTDLETTVSETFPLDGAHVQVEKSDVFVGPQLHLPL